MNTHLSSNSLQSLCYKLCLLSQKGLMQPHLGFSDYEQTPSPQKINCHNFQSRDTLQSLVQSCSCRDQSHGRSVGVQECKLHQPQQRNLGHNLLINYHSKNNIGMEKHYYSKAVQLEKQHSFSCGGTKLINVSSSEKEQKKRIRWTEDLHKKFIECVDRLGGAKKATPKGILKLMQCDGLTIFHIKSHLQKYRVSEVKPEEKDGNSEQIGLKSGMQIVEALRLQIDVQKQLYDQLESQKKLQMRIEEQAKQLQTMLESQWNTKK
ncbi:protein PHOSPHATE STARVATION RESPONSE 1-like [Salvia hispanica]|uniref:protein PHOSPHATE STARVATION RESPONSE 1-like n=1 Tax=Salvia hispanica TaxID=49212 RepID=UPI0020098B22|nr:protein PHOSPHATE STARVATION RESPONSE 1-like [Salvia hispanica]